MDDIYIIVPYTFVAVRPADTLARRLQFVRVNGWSADVWPLDSNGIACNDASIHQAVFLPSLSVSAARALHPHPDPPPPLLRPHLPGPPFRSFRETSAASPRASTTHIT